MKIDSSLGMVVAGALGLGLIAVLMKSKPALATGTVNVPPAGAPPSTPVGPAPAASALYTAPQYPPNDPSTVMLFQSAARYLNAPIEWANAGSAWHKVLEKESGGWVGRPNYHFGDLALISHRADWPSVWASIKAGTWRDMVLSQYKSAPSSATGLGQLTSTNIPSYYPRGLNGIGDPLEEAIGMLKYIIDRYKTPDAALAFHIAHNWY